MALLVDGDVSLIENLKAFDSGVLEVANGEGIDLHAKLRVGQLEVEADVERFLHWEDRGSLEQVQVNAALNRWHTLKTLEAVYRDAYFSQLNDRYGERWRAYEKMAATQERRYFDGGVAVVSRPVRRPEKITMEVTDGLNEPGTYWVQATLIDASGQESAPGPVEVVSSPLPHTLTVRLPYVREGVTGWNLFVGMQEDEAGLQNATPLGVNEVWTMPEGGIVAGRPPGTGQSADSVIYRSGRFRRG